MEWKLEALEAFLWELHSQWSVQGLSPGSLVRPTWKQTPGGSTDPVGEVRELRLGEQQKDAAANARALSDVCSVLTQIFHEDPNLVSHTMETLEKSRVICYKAMKSGRACWVVESTQHRGGGEKSDYACLAELRYCSCRSFWERAKNTGPGSEVFCKHVLALYVALFLKVYEEGKIADENFYKLLLPPR